MLPPPLSKSRMRKLAGKGAIAHRIAGVVGLFERAASNSVLEMKLIIQPPSAGACWLGTNDHLHLGTDKIMTHSVIRLKFHATQHWTSGRKDQSNSTPPHT